MTERAAPLLSVVVTVVDGGAALERTLDALRGQRHAPALDVVVPCDSSVADAAGIARRYAGVRVLELGDVRPARAIGSAAGQHELFDRRRAAGLQAATGDLVAILEDRGVPDPDWARALADLHGRLPHAVIGGAVAYGGAATLSRAVYLCDFGRYAPPLQAGPRDYVTDVNVCYKRAALERTRPLWQERYHETTVHWALRQGGDTLWLAPEPVVGQVREGLKLWTLLAERFAWGRLFAATRARESALPARLLRAVLSPLLPLVLWARIVRGAAGRGEAVPALGATPAVLVLLGAWACGEALGDITGKD